MRKTILLFSIMIMLYPGVRAQGFWTQLADVGTDGRYLSAGFAIGDYGYVCGGNLQGGAFTTELLRYDPISGNWTPKASMPFGAADGVTFVLNGRSWFTTGYTTFGGLIELYSYNPTPSNVWSVLTSFPGQSRSGAVAFSFPNTGIVGLGGDGSGNYFSDIYEYNYVTGNWTAKASFPGALRSHCGYFTIGTKGYIVSGESNSSFLSDVWEYNQVTNTWTQKADFPGSTRISGACFSIGNYGYIMGGETSLPSLLTDFWQYNSLSDTWSLLPPFQGNPRKEAAAFSIGTKGYVACGMNSPTALHDLWSFTPSGVGIENTETALNLSLYPNPGQGLFTLRFNGIDGKYISLTVRDISGRVVYNESLKPYQPECETTLDLSSLSPGMYILEAGNELKSNFSKIQIAR